MARNNGSISAKKLLQQIKAHLDEANRICGSWDYVDNCGSDEDTEQIEVNLDAAFEESLVLMEKLNLPDARRHVDNVYEAAKRDLAATKYSVGMCEPYLIWSYKLSQILGAIEHPEVEPLGALELVNRICDGFHRVALSLGSRRYADREKVLMNDEYDVQYLIGSLLAERFAMFVQRNIHPATVADHLEWTSC